MCHMNYSCHKPSHPAILQGVDFLKQHKLVLDLATSPETISTGSTKQRNPPKVEENGYEPVVFLVVPESERQAKMNVYYATFCSWEASANFSQVQVLEVIHVNQLQHSINQPTHDTQQGDCTPKQWDPLQIGRIGHPCTDILSKIDAS